MRRKEPKAFVLIELVAAITVLGIVAAAVVILSGNLSRGLSDVQDREVGIHLLQECADRVLLMRYRVGYDRTMGCSDLPVFDGFSVPSVTTTNRSGSPGSACPQNTQCKEVRISVSRGSEQFGPLVLLLVDH